METKDKVDLSSPIAYLTDAFEDRLRSLGDIPEKDREAAYNSIISPFLKAINLLKAYQSEE